ncbi:hypothetical protein [Tabrizicola aquatica]|uniref:hypothetical protein n=1 Tax=Tabrizicola aquatica TaxID=909926 RepID=UPI0011AF4173|nr:hypothetical protein [Tabrizicola aquatica]
MTRRLAIILSGLVLVGPTQADTITDSLFAEGLFSTLAPGEEITYAHVRSGPAGMEFPPVTEGAMVLSKPTEDAAHLSLTLVADLRRRSLGEFSAEGGNPVVLVFLESVARNVAALTGGSPFYIRNRIKDALRSGGDPTSAREPFAGRVVAAQAFTLRPFTDDPNRGRMGDLADLTLRFVVSPTVPGHVLSLSADTSDPATGYHETIKLTDAGKGGE